MLGYFGIIPLSNHHSSYFGIIPLTNHHSGREQGSVVMKFSQISPTIRGFSNLDLKMKSLVKIMVDRIFGQSQGGALSVYQDFRNIPS